jgi:phenylalanyl-tRNA synthetase beta chain
LKILVSWLRDHVDLPPDLSVRELASALNLLGFEVASIEPAPSGADDDGVIDLEITANRPDALSVFGMAREVSVRYRAPLRDEARRARLPGNEGLPLTVEIEAPDLCPRYAAAMAEVAPAPAPAWLAQRLAAVGVRPINNVVDVTNYVMLELGHPLHAFDYDLIGGATLRIRRARDGERMRTLDGIERTLDAEMLVIADESRATAIAGVMGGGDSEVSASTRRIALESAYFLPRSVRRASKRLGLSTEASYRFERGADPEAPVLAVARACELLEQIGAGRVLPGLIDAHPRPRPRAAITLRASRLAGLLGHEVGAPDVERILSGLGFDLEADGAGTWRVTVPGWRGDVTREIDLIEEVARHDGYDKLPVAFPALGRAPAAPDPRLAREALARRLALGAGFSECVTFTFVERSAAAPFADETSLVAIANPLSEKFAVLRPSLLPGLVDAVSHNRRREQRDVRLFETGTRFTAGDGEVRALGLAWTGAGDPPHWSAAVRPVDFFDIKGALELVCEGFGVEPAFEPVACPYLVPGRSARVTVGTGGDALVVGTIGELDPRLAAARGLPTADSVYVAELDLDAIADLTTLGADVRVRSLPKHPSIVRDLSIVFADHLPAARLRATIQQSAPATLVDLVEFARYQGKGVPEGHVSLSFRLTFQAPDRTLTDQEVQTAVEAVVAALGVAHGATLR